MMKKQYPFIKRKKSTNYPSNSIENQNTMTTKIFMFKCIKGGGGGVIFVQILLTEYR